MRSILRQRSPPAPRVLLGVLPDDAAYDLEEPLGEALGLLAVGAFGVDVEDGLVRVREQLHPAAVPAQLDAVDEPDLRAGVADRAVGGLGIFLVRRVMDEVAYVRDGSRNVLKLVIRRT
jgi:hypothetical protein